MREGDNSEDGEREERFENKTYGVFLLTGISWDFNHPRRLFVLLPSFYCRFLRLSLSSLALAASVVRHLSYYLLLVLIIFSVLASTNGNAIIFFFDIITTSIHPPLSTHHIPFITIIFIFPYLYKQFFTFILSLFCYFPVTLYIYTHFPFFSIIHLFFAFPFVYAFSFSLYSYILAAEDNGFIHYSLYIMPTAASITTFFLFLPYPSTLLLYFVSMVTLLFL